MGSNGPSTCNICTITQPHDRAWLLDLENAGHNAYVPFIPK